MTCEWIQVPGGVVVLCSRGRRSRTACRFCGVPGAQLLCDAPVVRRGAARTCDAPMCARCAHELGPDRHVCPRHVVVPVEARTEMLVEAPAEAPDASRQLPLALGLVPAGGSRG